MIRLRLKGDRLTGSQAADEEGWRTLVKMLQIGVPRDWVMRMVARRRAELANKVLVLLHPDRETDVCLEIGGPGFVATDILMPHFRRYLVLNLNPSELESILAGSNVVPVLGDGCHLPFADKSLDFVFSNAVIEHVSPLYRRFLAQEVQRVCKKGFLVATPNYWFPFEPHYHMPCFQYLPEAVKRALLRFFSIGYLNRDNYQPIHLLTVKELKALFPGAKVGTLRWTLLPENIFVYSYQQGSNGQEAGRGTT